MMMAYIHTGQNIFNQLRIGTLFLKYFDSAIYT